MDYVPLEDQVGAIAALQHPLSRRAYELVVDRGWVRVSAEPDAAGQALGEVARDTGHRMGHAAAEARGRSSKRTALLRSLTENGYRPRQHGHDIVLANCPFHALADHHPDLVCQMNLDLLTGVIDALDCAGQLSATLEPTDGQCCVRITSR